LGELQTISSKPTRTQLRRWTRCRAAWGRYAVTVDRVAALDTDERLSRVDLPPRAIAADWPAYQAVGERLWSDGFTLPWAGAAGTRGPADC
jgi:hypothetical protein